MRGYFIEATREMLKGEGLKSLNVRAVSERAGYSFATLYNYFKDLNELIFICVNDFMDECEAYINEQHGTEKPGAERLGNKMLAYVRYFTQYPGIFELFFVERMNDLGARQPTARTIYGFTDRIIEEDLNALIAGNTISPEKAGEIRLCLRNSVTGLLLFYINRLQPSDYKDFIGQANRQISQCIGL